MTTLSREGWPEGVEEARASLGKDPLNAEAAANLAAALGGVCAEPALAALREVCGVLEGGTVWPAEDAPATPLGVLDPAAHEALVIHPREKEERRHRFASLFGRVLHLLEG